MKGERRGGSDFQKWAKRMTTPRYGWRRKRTKGESEPGGKREKEEQAPGFSGRAMRRESGSDGAGYVGSLAGGILPFFFLSELKIWDGSAHHESCSPLLMVLYYLIFAPVVSMRERKGGEDRDDRFICRREILSLLALGGYGNRGDRKIGDRRCR